MSGLHLLQVVRLRLVVQAPLHVVARAQAQERRRLVAGAFDPAVEQVDHLAGFLIRPVRETHVVDRQEIPGRRIQKGLQLAFLAAKMPIGRRLEGLQ